MRRMEYRIITEDLNRDKIIELVSYHYSGFSITENTGFWNHEQEKSITISIIAAGSLKNLQIVRSIAESIRVLSKQESVLVTEHKIGAWFI